MSNYSKLVIYEDNSWAPLQSRLIFILINTGQKKHSQFFSTQSVPQFLHGTDSKPPKNIESLFSRKKLTISFWFVTSSSPRSGFKFIGEVRRAVLRNTQVLSLAFSATILPDLQGTSLLSIHRKENDLGIVKILDFLKCFLRK